MTEFFLSVLNMSLNGAFIIAVICLARKILKKSPKYISYGLWLVAWFRLLIPFCFESLFSLIPFKASPVPADIAIQARPQIDSGISAVNTAVNSVLPPAAPYSSVNPLQLWASFASYLWIAGFSVLLLYGFISSIRIMQRLKCAVHIKDNIYETENIDTPFVLGVLKPRIYLPASLASNERLYILLHEQTHIRRGDNIIKLAAYFILCLHWFNPLVWLAFTLMSTDMEMSCDENVLAKMDSDTRKDYSLSLLSLAVKKNPRPGLLAFGEGGIKERVENIMKLKKASKVSISIAIIFAALLSVGFISNRAGLSEQKTELSPLSTPYVGDSSAVGKIVDALPEIMPSQRQKFFSIGDDYGSGFAPFTLTLYYEPKEGWQPPVDIKNATAVHTTAAQLFNRIDNLQEVKFAFRETPSGDELDKEAYKSGIIFNREDVESDLYDTAKIEQAIIFPEIEADAGNLSITSVIPNSESSYFIPDSADTIHTISGIIKAGEIVPVRPFSLDGTESIVFTLESFRYASGEKIEIDSLDDSDTVLHISFDPPVGNEHLDAIIMDKTGHDYSVSQTDIPAFINHDLIFSIHNIKNKDVEFSLQLKLSPAVPAVIYNNVKVDWVKPGEDDYSYIQDSKTNNTDKKITAAENGMLAFDKEGNPLKIAWVSNSLPLEYSYYFLHYWGESELSPGETDDGIAADSGGWTINPYGEDPDANEITYVLYCDKKITFEDGTVWENSDFDKWRETYEGKKIDTAILDTYYPFVQKIMY